MTKRTGLIAFTRENVARILNKAGNYYFYSRARRLLYVGWSAILKHRLQSYYQDDDFREHHTKKALRPRIAFFSVVYRPMAKARKVELKVKDGARFNVLKREMAK